MVVQRIKRLYLVLAAALVVAVALPAGALAQDPGFIGPPAPPPKADEPLSSDWQGPLVAWCFWTKAEAAMWTYEKYGYDWTDRLVVFNGAFYCVTKVRYLLPKVDRF